MCWRHKLVWLGNVPHFQENHFFRKTSRGFEQICRGLLERAGIIQEAVGPQSLHESVIESVNPPQNLLPNPMGLHPLRAWVLAAHRVL